MILAEFIINIGASSTSLEQFVKKLDDSESGFTLEFMKNLYDIIKKSKGNIQSETEKFNKKSKLEENKFQLNELSKNFKALCIPNRNKEELDIELGVVFENNNEIILKKEEKDKKYSRSPSIKSVSNKNKRSRSRSRSRRKSKENKILKSNSRGRTKKNHKKKKIFKIMFF